MDGQGTHLSCLGDLEYLDHLECLGGKIGGKVLKMIKVLNILMAGDLSIFALSLGQRAMISSARPACTSADVM